MTETRLAVNGTDAELSTAHMNGVLSDHTMVQTRRIQKGPGRTEEATRRVSWVGWAGCRRRRVGVEVKQASTFPVIQGGWPTPGRSVCWLIIGLLGGTLYNNHAGNSLQVMLFSPSPQGSPTFLHRLS